MSTAAAEESGDFSLIMGGPLYQLWRRMHLTGTALQFVTRRVIVLSLVAWLPLLVLSAIEGLAWNDAVRVPFLFDFDAHMRFLIALPLFIAAELVVNKRMQMVVQQFYARGLVPTESKAKFESAISSALKLRNSLLAEIFLLAFVYLVGVLVVWRFHGTISVSTWHGTELHQSMAGWWFGLVSLPLVQFILLRWYFRMFIWARFLWQVSGIELNLVPTHPDRAGGLGFIGNTVYAFAPLLTGQGVLLAGVMANKIFFAGAKFPDFKLELFAMVVFMILVVLGPILVFIPRLARAKQKGLFEYGVLAQHYAREFDQKWVRGGKAESEQLLGSADIQSLADMGNSFEVVRSMKLVPITKETLFQLVLVTLLPVLPLVLTMIPLTDLLDRLVNIVF